MHHVLTFVLPLGKYVDLSLQISGNPLLDQSACDLACVPPAVISFPPPPSGSLRRFQKARRAGDDTTSASSHEAPLEFIAGVYARRGQHKGR